MVDYFPDFIARQTVAYTGVASAVALLFDFCITFDSEVRWTWGRKWGITRISFVISRYLPLVGVTLMTRYAVEATHGGIANYAMLTPVSDSCEYIHFLGAFAAEVLLLVRIYVFWGCDKRFLVVISVFSMATAIAMLTIAGIDKIGNSTDSTHRVLEVDKNASIIYGLLVLFELVLLSLTLYKRFKTHRLENSPIVVTIYRDGVIYMLCITLVSMVNCIVIFALPSSYTALLIG
ncbi:hypothetical protein K503DRAFT_862144 [Rhizopogon vinicolor AM-OR11-026]|uniref:DUF6533 domain-containing protein n=1 Tax=Rhizopogon vinicolor AM-OR11-026 TaxID=1314800 RepID=A0A1B7NFN5_9AGAM|nr:hypothetical protein K503DRAFT_862144 [Rhizopogon vinicolor AM-OR11-026]